MEAPQQIQAGISDLSVQAQDPGVSVGGVQASPDVEITATRSPAFEAPSVETPQLNLPNNGGGGGGPVATQPVVEPPQLSRPGGSSGGGTATTQPVQVPDLNVPTGGVSVGGSDGAAPVDVPELSVPSLSRTNRPRGGNTGRSGRQRGDRGGSRGGGSTGGGSTGGGSTALGARGLKVISAEGEKKITETNFLNRSELVSENGRVAIFRLREELNPWITRHNLRDLALVDSMQVMDLSGSTPTPVPPPQTGKNGVVVEVKEGELYNFEASFMNTMGEEKVGEAENVLTYRITASTPPELLAQRLRDSDIVVSAEAVNIGGGGGGGGGSSVQDIIEYGQTLAGLAEALNGTLQPLKQIQSSYPEDIASRAASLESDVRNMVNALNQEIARVRSWLQRNTAQPTTRLQPGGNVSMPQLNAGLSVGGSVPQLNSGDGAAIPELNTGGGASVPRLDTGSGAAIPRLDTGGGASVPRLDTGGGAAIPRLDVGSPSGRDLPDDFVPLPSPSQGGASVPRLDTGGGAAIPRLDTGGGASVPRLRSGDGQSVDVGGVTVGGSLPELSV